jgi:hypothetical protein
MSTVAVQSDVLLHPICELDGHRKRGLASMSLDIRRPRVRLSSLPLISAVATILIAATVDPERNWARLRALPPNERQRLDENLRKFDLLYSPVQQQSLRDLDKRINEIEPTRQTDLLAALHRYHNWLNLLPETKQEELKQTPPAQRMVLVKKLLSDHPIAKVGPAPFLRFIDVGEDTPFELAAIYKIWVTLEPEERADVEKVPRGPRRRARLFELGDNHKLPRELKPDDFDEERWTGELEAFAKKNRPALLLEELRKKQEARRQEIIRRQMINYHYLEKGHHPKGVTPERLAEFLAKFPPWLQSSFDHYTPEEAKRRLTIVYRLVFPPPAEINTIQKAVAAPPVAATTTTAKPGSSRGKQKPKSKAPDTTKSAKSPF